MAAEWKKHRKIHIHRIVGQHLLDSGVKFLRPDCSKRDEVPDRIPKHIIHDAVHLRAVHQPQSAPPGLPQQKHIRMLLLQHNPCHLPDALVDFIRDIQPPPIDLEFRYPKIHHAQDERPNFRISAVELRHVLVRTDTLVVMMSDVKRKIPDEKPVPVAGALLVFQQILEWLKMNPAVVEHSVQDNPHPGRMNPLHQFLQILIGPELRIDLKVICRCILVIEIALEDRIQIETVHAKFLQVRQFPDNSP